ncbi:MAG: hypothetical protein P4L68_09285 [Methylovirgula sp.]|nr:hypothetical protein [Methylovirgula sp.]
MSDPFQVSLAPQQLWQAINPWTFYQQGSQIGLINIDLGQTPSPQTERNILNDVGSYGRQIGHIGDALEVILDHMKLNDLEPAEKDAIDILRGQLAQVRRIKARLEAAKTNPQDAQSAPAPADANN